MFISLLSQNILEIFEGLKLAEDGGEAHVSYFVCAGKNIKNRLTDLF